MKDAPNWGITPVPERFRVLGLLDGFLLWANLSVSLLVIVAGAFLVLPGSEFGLELSLPRALATIVAAAIVGNAMLALGGLIGADARVPTMVLLRAPLGHRGSYLPTALNVLQCFGWSIFELIIIATGASALSEQVFGFGGKPVWTLAMGGIATALALLGPVGFVRRYVRKFAIWFVIASLVYLAWWSLHGQHVGRVWDRPGEPAFWAGFDLVLASLISWTPLVADYTRFARTRRDAFWGTGLGYFVPTIPLFALGAVIALTRHISDAPGLLTAIAAGGAASVLALLALTVDESDEAFANVYSAAVSLQNVLPDVPQRILVAGTAVIATAGALLIDLRNYQTFLYLLGSFFVPLFGVLVADWLLAGRHYEAADIFDVPAFRPALIVAWLAGFCLYQWLYPNGPSWWTDIVVHAHPHSLPWGGASLPSFAVAFALAALARLALRRESILAGA
ncbi:MAG TPA: cytosine permease [Gaiellaceae bacterium]|jgi:putative hydroxymethylpyrimidine transporter CytX